ncbi:serine/threonine protein phosphatase [Mycobacterium hodleri]|uniref:Serine/threonine protein phosphatase n=2 Tax=Mycolicibacterium hodleri TaxID=49897 RepID=A0A502EBN1_9MYCO|nr:serine/threonine protein phosphatase [Mycolicibacterium hodleri]
MLIVCALAAIALTSWLSFAMRPATFVTYAWWPAAGIALGLGIRFRIRYLWVLALAVTAVTLPILFWAGRSNPIAISVSVGVEMIVGTLILRGRQDKLPTLDSPRDLARLVVATVVAAVVYDLLAVGIDLLLGDPTMALTRLITVGPKHAAGMLLVTPLFMEIPRRDHPATRFETVAQPVATLGVAMFVFVSNERLPLAFLPFLPLIWTAMRLSTRQLQVQMLAIAVIASRGSALGAGPFSFERLGPDTGSTVLQIFELSMVLVFLALSLTVGLGRDTAQRLTASEELFRRSFDSSVAGKLLVTHDAEGWSVQRSNASAALMLPGLRDGQRVLSELLGSEATSALVEKAESLSGDSDRFVLTLSSGRSLQMSIALLSEGRGHEVFALHFHDITESLRVRRLEREELERAGEVQRALTPKQLPCTPGWGFGAVSEPAKQVGGDFYDIRLDLPYAVLGLGDVMGKGVAAGMLASAARSALRCNHPKVSPSVAVGRAARVLDSDLQQTDAFITLAYVLVDLGSGDFRLTDAGHGLHFILRGDSTAVERRQSRDLPIGVGDDWHELRDTLAPGDAILLVSDGVLDLWGDSVSRLHDAVTRYAKECRTDPQALVEALCGGQSGSVDSDDVTAVVLCRNPSNVDALSAAPGHGVGVNSGSRSAADALVGARASNERIE